MKLELAQKAARLNSKQIPAEKRKLSNMVHSNSFGWEKAEVKLPKNRLI